MNEFLFLLQLCAASLCTPADRHRLDLIVSNCGGRPECISRMTHRNQVEVTPSGVTILRGR